jgi:putative transposase
VLDLYSRAVIGWSMKPSLAKELALDALLMAIWRRRPKAPLMIHSDQACSTAAMTGSGSVVRTASR